MKQEIESITSKLNQLKVTEKKVTKKTRKKAERNPTIPNPPQLPQTSLQNKNKGTGAGGANTNRNGLSYEKMTDLSTEYKIIGRYCYHRKRYYGSVIRFKINKKKKFKYTEKHGFLKCTEKYRDKEVEIGHGCKQPDGCFIDEKTKIIFIIEKKNQNVAGSVCEKIQSVPFKLHNYEEMFPEFKVVYIYCLSRWFQGNCKAELKFLDKYENVEVFWGDSETFKKDLVNFIVNYKLSPPSPSNQAS